MKLFWISWEQPTDDYRPLSYPPNENVLAWWCSGEGDDYYTLCAWVQAGDQAGAEAAVSKDWPEARHGRILEEREHVTHSDRFPVQHDWERERLAKWEV